MALRELEDAIRQLQLSIRELNLSNPVGIMQPFAAGTVPAGWLLCDGSAVSRTEYPALFATIGTTYGAGNGSSTFNLPNAKGRTLVGRDAAQTEFNALGKTGGAKTHTLSVAEMPSHTHSFLYNSTNYGSWNIASTTYPGTGNITFGIATPAANTPVSIASAGSGGAHNNLQPYLTVNYIIRAA